MQKWLLLLGGLILFCLSPCLLASEAQNSQKISEQLKMGDDLSALQEQDELPAPIPTAECCSSLDQLIERLKLQNFNIRENAEKVYQARKQVQVQVGLLLPSLNFGNILTTINFDAYSLASSMLGFLFPSRWFEWHESQLFFKAEQWGHVTLVANQVNALISIAYQINYLKSLIGIYKLYRKETLDLIKQSDQIVGEWKDDSIYLKMILKNFAILLYDDQRRIEGSLLNLKYMLAYTIDLEEKYWSEFTLPEIPLPNLYGRKPLVAHDLAPIIIEKSPELQEINCLIEASKYSTLSRGFQFLTPNSSQDSSLGLGYASYIKIGRSKIHELKIQKQSQEAKLDLALYNAIKDYNMMIKFYRSSAQGVANGRVWINSLHARVANGGRYDTQELVDSLQSMLGFHSAQLSAQHQFLISKAVIDRLLLKGQYYHDLMSLAPQKPQKPLSLPQQIENWKIKHAQKKGKLVVS